MEHGYLVLENGRTFKGIPFGAKADTLGELVFATGMTGYLETLTDPSYYGQIVLQTFPLIGNPGMIPEDFESAGPALRGYVVRECCGEPSNFRCGGTVDAYLKERGIPGLYGVDTREITRILREHGVMNARICTEPCQPDEALRSYKVRGAVQAVGCPAPVEYPAENGSGPKVVLWDFGAKQGIVRSLNRRGCTVVKAPPGCTAGQILELAPDGVLLSNGPGDPAENTGIIRELSELCRTGIPIFGICLGHQLLALSQGGKTVKLKYGHRGANQPVRDTQSGRVYITSQNHGYAVDTENLPEHSRMRFQNVNDGTCEGIAYEQINAFSAQFHPEACAGPMDTRFLFDEFLKRIEEGRSCR